MCTYCGDNWIVYAEHIMEVCEDGNTEDGDGCSADCTMIEPGYYCTTPGEPCEPPPWERLFSNYRGRYRGCCSHWRRNGLLRFFISMREFSDSSRLFHNLVFSVHYNFHWRGRGWGRRSHYLLQSEEMDSRK
jgi:cysteine-rich repeat protein